MPYLLFLVIVAIWGSSFILMKRAAVCLSPVGVSAGRVVCGAAVLFLVWRLSRQPARVRRADLWTLLGIIVTGFAWPYTVQPWLIATHQASAFVGMTVGFTPLLTLGLSVFILDARPTARQLIGVCGALGCLCVLMWDGWKQNIPPRDLALAFSVPLTYAVANNWMRRSLQHVPAVELTLLCLAGSALLLAPLTVFSSAPATATAGGLGWSYAAIGVLGVLGTGLATCLFTHLVQQQGPLFAAMVTNLVPIIAVVWGWADAEMISPRQIAALAGVLAMVVLVQYGAAKPAAR